MFFLGPGKCVQIHISAGDDHAHPFTPEDLGVFQYGGQGNCAAGLDNNLHSFPGQLHGVDDFLLGRRENV